MSEQELIQLFNHQLTQFRMQKGLSARDMSLSLGYSESLINQIENKKIFPSMTLFFRICVFLNIHPKVFFNETPMDTAMNQALYEEISKLPLTQVEPLLQFFKEINKNNITHKESAPDRS